MIALEMVIPSHVIYLMKRLQANCISGRTEKKN